jgi:hypothetical protein
MQIIVLLTVLSLAPAILIMMTSFTHHHRALAAPPGNGHPAIAAESDPHGAGAVHDLHRDGADVSTC